MKTSEIQSIQFKLDSLFQSYQDNKDKVMLFKELGINVNSNEEKITKVITLIPTFDEDGIVGTCELTISYSSNNNSIFPFKLLISNIFGNIKVGYFINDYSIFFNNESLFNDLINFNLTNNDNHKVKFKKGDEECTYFDYVDYKKNNQIQLYTENITQSGYNQVDDNEYELKKQIFKSDYNLVIPTPLDEIDVEEFQNRNPFGDTSIFDEEPENEPIEEDEEEILNRFREAFENFNSVDEVVGGQQEVQQGVQKGVQKGVQQGGTKGGTKGGTTGGYKRGYNRGYKKEKL